MRFFLLVLFLAFAGAAQAQLFGGDDSDGWRRHKKVHCELSCRRREGWREEERERAEARRRRRYAREYAERMRYNEIDEDRDSRWRRQRRERYHREQFRSWRYREREEGYAGWRARDRAREDGYRDWRSAGKHEGYHGWWRPEGGWRDSELRDGPRRCRPPMHAAGDARPSDETALNLAIKSWQEQVINEHGERFLNYDAAFVIEQHCDPARVGNESRLIELKRCVVTAAPCLKRSESDRPREEREEDGRQRRREEKRR